MFRLTLLFFVLSLGQPALAQEKPNLTPGLWSYDTTITTQGPMQIPPQHDTREQCFTQADLDNGEAALEIPESCTISRKDIQHDRVDYAARCDMQGMVTTFEGFADFNGDKLNGEMRSEMQTPVGKLNMLMEYSADRLGDC